jgi:hypothetical protein
VIYTYTSGFQSESRWNANLKNSPGRVKGLAGAT